MPLKLTVIGPDPATESRWAVDLKRCLRDLSGVDDAVDAEVALSSSDPAYGAILFVGAKQVPQLESVDRKGRAVFLIVNEDADVPAVLADRKVDDVLVYPFRRLELLGKIQHYKQILMWDQVHQLNVSVSEVIERLQEDLRFAERLQKSKLPVRFPEIRNFKVTSRYLAGARSGGDHFDIADSRDGSHTSIVLSDSSSYGLSSAVLAVLVKVALKLSGAAAYSCYETVERIRNEIQTTLKEKDRLSLFYGMISQKDLVLSYLSLGESSGYYSEPGQSFTKLPSQGDPIRSTSPKIEGKESILQLHPGGRLVLMSDGFTECMGGASEVVDVLNGLRTREGADVVNEMIFRVKKKFDEPDDLPAQDCSVVLLDADSKVLRLARN
jgi:hypothetical protein